MNVNEIDVIFDLKKKFDDIWLRQKGAKKHIKNNLSNLWLNFQVAKPNKHQNFTTERISN